MVDRNLTYAEALCWVAILCRREADACFYGPVRDAAEGERLVAAGELAFAEAAKLDASDDLWQRAYAKFDVEG